MTQLRSYTTIEQSRKLAEFLPVESSDMFYPYFGDDIWGDTARFGEPLEYSGKRDIPCWSLAALLSVLPNNKHITTTVSKGSWQIDPIKYLPNTWWCEYEDSKNLTEFNISADNPTDACVSMILKLHKQNLL